jgi:hypothetical protein
MEHYLQDVSIFLNNLDTHIYDLVSPTTRHVLQEPGILDDISHIVIYGNKKIYIDAYFKAFVKSKYAIDTLKTKVNTFSDIEYEYSDYHFEIDFSTKYIPFIKSMIRNLTISKRQVIFYLKNMDMVDKNDHLSIVRLMEQYPMVKFIMSTNNLANIHINLMSHLMPLRLYFPITSIYLFMVKEKHFKGTSMTDFLSLYEKCQNNMLIFIARSSNNSDNDAISDQTNIDLSLVELITYIKKEKNQLNIITRIREMCYKLYHLNIPLRYVCKVILKLYYKDQKIITQLVQISSLCEHESLSGTKNILVYEKFFLSLSKLIKP